MKKTKILLLGYSNIARKRLIKVFLDKKIQLSIASKSHKKKIVGIYKQYFDYDKALNDSDANIVYISLPNSLHFYWAKKALLNGYHVIVDKPICYKVSETNQLIKIARVKKKLLSEAIFFNYHKQIKRVNKTLSTNRLISIRAKFIIPVPRKNSILISKKLRGGVIMDMGPYASSIHRIFFNKKIISKKIDIKSTKSGLPISFEIKVNYNNKNFYGLFEFGNEYKNQIIFFTKKKILSINRAFSPPHDLSLNLKLIEKNREKNIKISKDNCFENYLNELLDKIDNKQYFFYLNQIKQDHIFRDKIEKKNLLIK